MVRRAHVLARAAKALERIEGLLAWACLVVLRREPVPETLGEMVESGAPSGCRARSVRSPCTCRCRTVGSLKLQGFRRQCEGFCQVRAPFAASHPVSRSASMTLFFFFWVWIPHSLLPSIVQTRICGVALLGEPGGSPARRHSCYESCSIPIFFSLDTIEKWRRRFM